MKTYANLHTHTIYSFLDGYSNIERLVDRAKSLGMPALAQTDHGNVHGWLDFYMAAKDAGIQPLLGMEAYMARKTRFDRDEEERSGKAADDADQRGPYHLTLFARNEAGYRNLIKLSSKAYLEGYYGKPRLDHELLAMHSEGVTALSGCLNGIVCQALLRRDDDYALRSALRLQEIFGKDHFFIEIMNHGLSEQSFVNRKLVEIAARIDAKIVPTGDCHYVTRDEAHSHDVMLCVSTGATLHQENRFKFSGPEFYLKDYAEMAERFDESWLRNTLYVVEQADLNLDFGELYFPEFDLPPGREVDGYLDEMVWAGLKERYGDPLPQNVVDRATYELGAIKRMGFQSYFLVVADLVGWAKRNDIRVGWGRGSAAGCIISYALRITDLDPIRFDLLFERFLVEGRKSMPDIDLDFDDRHRDRVIEYARNRYGDERVAHICTFSRLNARQALRDSTRVLGYDYIDGDKLSKALPPPVLGITQTIQESLDSTPEFKKLYESSNSTKHIVETAMGLEGLLRQPGIHAAGVIIARSNVTDFVPVMRKGEGSPIIAQWDDDAVEMSGQLKIDFLGLRNLGVIDMCIANIKLRHGTEIDVNKIPLDDEKTYKGLCEGRSIGVFQLESQGMRDKMLAMQPSNIEDIMALISLYRPGPLGSGMDKIYITRKHGRSSIDYAHPQLAEVLSSTYGIMLYQEDVLAVSRVLAGFTSAEADDLRKAIGKKQLDKIGLFRKKFVDGCAKTHNVDASVANKIYSDIEFFGGYGFNRAHAASYAMVSYVTAYLKFNYPAEYMAALLSSVKDKREKATTYLNECRELGITVLPPSINESFGNFSVVSDGEILFGLESINGVGPAVYAAISNADRPFQSMRDFMLRCDMEVLDSAVLEHLMNAGAFDELVPEQPERIMRRETRMEILDREKNELGLFITDHPLSGAWHLIAPQVTCNIQQLEDASIAGTFVSVGGIISEVQRRKTKKGDLMLTFKLEDLTGRVDIVVFPKVAATWADEIHDGEIVIVEGRVSQETYDEAITYKIFFQKMHKPDISDIQSGPSITLRFEQQPAYSTMNKMAQVIESSPGDSPVYIEVAHNQRVLVFRAEKSTSLKIKNDLELLALADRGV